MQVAVIIMLLSGILLLIVGCWSWKKLNVSAFVWIFFAYLGYVASGRLNIIDKYAYGEWAYDNPSLVNDFSFILYLKLSLLWLSILMLIILVAVEFSKIINQHLKPDLISQKLENIFRYRFLLAGLAILLAILSPVAPKLFLLKLMQ